MQVVSQHMALAVECPGGPPLLILIALIALVAERFSILQQ
jgi:hypothetical protein